MNASSDSPLDLPVHTLDAIDKARNAAQRARQTVEVSFALVLAGAASAFVGLGGFILVAHASLPDWAQWSALLFCWSGILLMYFCLWAWLRRGRWGGRHSPLGDASTPLSNRRRFGSFAIGFSVMLLSTIVIQLLRGRIPDGLYYGVLTWISRLWVLGGLAFYVRRFVRSGFWEHLVFAAGIAGTWGLILFFFPLPQPGIISPAPAYIAAVSMLTTLVAAASLIGRWRRWARANKAADAIDDPTSMEIG